MRNSARTVGIGYARATQTVAGVQGGDIRWQEFFSNKVDFVKVRVLIQQQHSHCSLAPDALLGEDGQTVSVQSVVAV